MKAGDAIGEWVVVRTLGKGGMGTVFLCHHRDDESNFAALKLFPSWSTDEDGFKRFQRECDVLGRLRHRGIVPLKAGTTSFGRDAGSGVYWLAMEYVDGPSLEARLDHGPLPPGYASDVFHTLAEALEYAHRQGVFHRDIKPANIVLGSDGVRLVDFGIALQEEKARLTAVGTFAGTLAYMAPEVVVDDRSRPDPVLGDIYALGVVLYEAITARRAFATESGLSERERQMRILRMKMSAHVLDPGDDVPPPLRELVRRATAPRPDDRIQGWSEFRSFLEEVPFAHDLPIVVDMTPAARNDEEDLPMGDSTATGYRRRVTRPARGLRLGRRPSYAPSTDPSGVRPPMPAGPSAPQGRAFTSFDGDNDSGFTELPSRDDVTEATEHPSDTLHAIGEGRPLAELRRAERAAEARSA
ncbi:MAG TPA: serine/threonine-protein kinase, partial [Myxococcota bacterium]|nr:serine/threonine-protein kinase [Myxococcota bacterium]